MQSKNASHSETLDAKDLYDFSLVVICPWDVCITNRKSRPSLMLGPAGPMTREAG